MRMAASWFGSVDPPNTSMWRDWSAPPSELPSDRHPDPQQASRRCSEPPSRPNKSCDGPKSQLLRAPARPPPRGAGPRGNARQTLYRSNKETDHEKSRTSSHKTRLTTKSPYKLGRGLTANGVDAWQTLS